MSEAHATDQNTINEGGLLHETARPEGRERLTDAHARVSELLAGRNGLVDELDGDRRQCRRGAPSDGAVKGHRKSTRQEEPSP